MATYRNALGQIDPYKSDWTSGSWSGTINPGDVSNGLGSDSVSPTGFQYNPLLMDWWNQQGFQGNAFQTGQGEARFDQPQMTPELAAWAQANGYAPGFTEGYGGILKNGQIQPGTALGNRTNDDAMMIAALLAGGVVGSAAYGAAGAAGTGAGEAAGGAAGAAGWEVPLAESAQLPAEFGGFQGVGAQAAEKAAEASFWDTAAGQAIKQAGVGAATGAARSALTGGDVKSGAIGGAIGGGIDGYNSGGSAFQSDNPWGTNTDLSGSTFQSDNPWGTNVNLGGGGGGGTSLSDFFSGNGNVSDYGRLAQGLIGLYSNNRAAGAAQQGQADQMALIREAMAKNQPLIDTRNNALGQINGLMADPSSITKDPGYQFGLKQSLDQFGNSQAAKGGYYSGQQIAGGIERAGQYANNRLDQTYNRLLGAAGLGQQGGASNTNLSLNLGQGAANMGSIRGSGYIGAGNTVNNALGDWTNDWVNRKTWGGPG